MKKLLTMVVVELMLTGTALAQAKIPDIHIEMSYRQREDGKLSEGVHVFELWCADGRCDLTVTTINQCFWGLFTPKVERSSNMIIAGQREGTLKVTYSGQGILQLEEDIVEGKISYFLRFREAKTEIEKLQTLNNLFPKGDIKVKKTKERKFYNGKNRKQDKEFFRVVCVKINS